MPGAVAERYGWSRWDRLAVGVVPHGGGPRLRERYFWPDPTRGGGFDRVGFAPVHRGRRGRTWLVAPAGGPGWDRLRPGWAHPGGTFLTGLAGLLRRG